jgi:hypothetical protein
MKSLRPVAFGLCLLLFAAFSSPAAFAAANAAATASASSTFRPTAGVFPPNVTVRGLTYAQLSARNWEWTFNTSLHGPKGQVAQAVAPFIGPVNCRYGQVGTVWFLQPPIGSATTPVKRSCTVPRGTVIFFPVYSAWQDNLNYPGQPPTTYTVSQMRQLAAGYLSNAQSLRASVDGHPIASLTNLSSAYRTKSPVFHYVLPADSFYNAYFGLTWPAGTRTPPPGAVADGVYVALKPLAPGRHIIRWGATGSNLLASVTYTITVPRT